MIKQIFTIEDNYQIVPRRVINKSSKGGYIVKGGKEINDNFYTSEKEAKKAVEYMKENHIVK